MNTPSPVARLLVAGGWPVSRVTSSAASSDIDLFTDGDPYEVAVEAGLEDIQVKSDRVVTSSDTDVIRIDEKPFIESVLGSFDIGLTQVGFDPLTDQWYVTDLWLEHAPRGMLEFDPMEDLYARPVRTSVRLNKYIKRLGFELGPRALAFAQERAAQGWSLESPKDGFVIQGRYRPVYPHTLAELQDMVKHTQGPRHILEAVYANAVSSPSSAATV